jgi:hypothetical protein
VEGERRDEDRVTGKAEDEVEDREERDKEEMEQDCTHEAEMHAMISTRTTVGIYAA